MAPPTSYTEESLAEFAHVTIRDLAEKCGWAPEAGFYQEVVNEVMLVFGVTVLSGLTGNTNMRELRAITRREAWKAVLSSLASKHAFNADFQVFSRQQMFDMAKQMYVMAVGDCAALGVDSPNYAVTVQSLVLVDDPYVPYRGINPLVEYQPWP